MAWDKEATSDSTLVMRVTVLSKFSALSWATGLSPWFFDVNAELIYWNVDDLQLLAGTSCLKIA